MRRSKLSLNSKFKELSNDFVSLLENFFTIIKHFVTMYVNERRNPLTVFRLTSTEEFINLR